MDFGGKIGVVEIMGLLRAAGSTISGILHEYAPAAATQRDLRYSQRAIKYTLLDESSDANLG